MERISYREFGRRVGRSDTTIRKAIDSGVISDECIVYRPSGRPELIYDKALQDWNNNGGGMQAETKELPPAASNYQLKSPPAQPVDAVQNTASEQAAQQSTGFKAPLKQPPTEQEIANKSSIMDSRRVIIQVQAQKELIELQVIKNALVKKDDSDAAFFAYGRIIREQLTVLPSRLTELIRNAATTRAAFKLFEDEVHAILTKLSTPPQL